MTGIHPTLTLSGTDVGLLPIKLIAIVYEQPRRVAQAIKELGYSKLDVDLRAIESSIDRLLRRFYTRPIEEINLADKQIKFV